MSDPSLRTATVLLGRERELALLTGWPVESDVAPRRCIVAEPGVGKSTLLAAAVDALAVAGVRALRCAPTPAESELAYAAIADLLSGFSAWDALGDTAARALRCVLYLDPDPTDDPPDTRRIAQACVAAWAIGGPTVLAVDDVQWLDAASAAVLAYVARRLPDSIAMLAARRSGVEGPTLPLDELPLPGLDDSSLLRLVTDRATRSGAGLPAPAARRVVAAAGGNPLFAIELARAAAAGPDDGSIVVPATLDALIAERFGDVDPATVEALASVALLATPDLATVARLDVTDAIERAEADGLLDTSGGRVRFAHPLFSAAMVARLTPSQRRRAHARLAVVVDDPTQAAVHAARAAVGPDAAVARRLIDAAGSVASRGAIDNAADFAELAVRLTPEDDDALTQRIIVAAELAFQAGDTDATAAMLAELDRVAERGALLAHTRWAGQLLRAKVEFSAGSSRRALLFAESALDLAVTDLDRIEAHSIMARVNYEDFDESTACAERAYELALGAEVPPAVMVSVLVAVGTGRLMVGRGLQADLWERAIELERSLDVYAPDSAEASLAALLKITDELDEARRRLLDLLQRTTDDGALPFVLSHLPQLELWSGNWDRAEDYAQRHLEAAVRSGQLDQASQARTNLALIDIHRGMLDTARPLASRIRDDGVAGDDAWTERSGLGLLGLIAMADGDAEQAVGHLGRWHELAEQMALREPGYCRFQADYVEALIATGRLDEAERYVAMMRDRAAALQRSTAVAIAARVDALLLAARGERDRAVEQANVAVDVLAASPLVVEHARALMSLGQIHRRFKEKAAARRALEAALATFERLGAEPFAERARQDLERVGGRHAGPVALTETERRVAVLAAAGRTMRQVGDELFISPKTAEANLTRVYRKLGLSNRAELTAWSLRVGDQRDG